MLPKKSSNLKYHVSYPCFNLLLWSYPFPMYDTHSRFFPDRIYAVGGNSRQFTFIYKREIISACEIGLFLISVRNTAETEFMCDIKLWYEIYVYWTVHHLDSWIKIDQFDVTCFIIWLFTAQHVYWTVRHLDSWMKIDQLDVTCFIISLFTAQNVSNVLTFETCWAVNSEIIKQVTSSWSIFIQLWM